MGKAILVINGPNLNTLGRREPGIYGKETLADIETLCQQTGEKLGVAVEFRQSNDEGQLVAWIQEASSKFQGIVINAAAYTHTSVAIRDALLSGGLPVIEVHLSNIFKRETFRQHSYIADIAKGVICGLGSQGYALALQAIVKDTVKPIKQ